MIDPRNMPNKPSTATKALDGLTGLAAERLNTRSRVAPLINMLIFTGSNRIVFSLININIEGYLAGYQQS